MHKLLPAHRSPDEDDSGICPEDKHIGHEGMTFVFEKKSSNQLESRETSIDADDADVDGSEGL